VCRQEGAGRGGKARAARAADRNATVCAVCEEGGRLLCCEGGCCRAYHLHCLGLTAASAGISDAGTPFVCDTCLVGTESCPVCRQLGPTAEMRRCDFKGCGKCYHASCTVELPKLEPAEFGLLRDQFACPRHRCASCKLADFDEGLLSSSLPHSCSYVE
jgi:hypothetical protein